MTQGAGSNPPNVCPGVQHRQICVSLADIEADKRSSRRVFRASITNNSNAPIYIFNYSIHLSPKGRLEECSEEYLIHQKVKFERVKDQLGFLAEAILASCYPEIGAKLISSQQSVLLTTLKAANRLGFLYGFAGDILFRLLSDAIRSSSVSRLASVYIGTAEEGRLFRENVLKDGKADGAILNLFDYTLLQLEHLENKFAETKKPVLTLEPGETYSPPVTIEYRRDLFNQRSERVEVVFDCAGDIRPGALRWSASAETVTSVTPKPGMLSFITMLSSILGSILLHYEGLKNINMSGLLSCEGVQSALACITSVLDAHMQFNAHALGGVITSFLFFNVYELIHFTFAFSFKVDWRGALLFGFTCGYYSDWIVTNVLPLLLPTGK